MKKPETIKRGRPEKYDWNPLKKKGDFVEYRKADSGQANSLRTIARNMGIKVSVSKMVKGGYLIELLEDRA